jgi:predicted nucleic acid-binding protein
MPLPLRVFCDTSYFYACADTLDTHHERALALATEAERRQTQLWTTWDVVSETITLLRYRHSSAAALRFLDDVKPGLHVAAYGADLRTRRKGSSVDMRAITACPSATRSRSSW